MGALAGWVVSVHDGQMARWIWVAGGAAVFVAGTGLGLFLVSQGLGRASAWVTVLGFPLVLAGATAGVWAVVQAARTGRAARHTDMTPQQESQNPPRAGMPARPSVNASGSIRQRGRFNVGHTGQGDINLHKPDQ